MSLENTNDLTNSAENELLSTDAIQENFEVEQDFIPTNKLELLAHAEQLHTDVTDVTQLFNKLKKLKPFLDEFLETEKSLALDAYISEGGDADDFEFRYDAETAQFEQKFKQTREKFSKQQSAQIAQKDANLKAKQDILQSMRNLLDAEEDTKSHNTFKALQQSWKTTGAVPQAQAQELWANYNALVTRFFNNRSIFFELKELDRKKNLVLKTELCVKAEALKNETLISKALKELNEIHQEYKELGPVPQENQEEIWLRLKAATDAIYVNKRNFEQQRHSQEAANLALKKELIPTIQALENFSSDSIQEWNKQSEKIVAIKDAWSKIGAVDKDKSNGVDKLFWASFKGFFAKKAVFYQQLDSIRTVNQERKEALIAKAEALLETEDIEQAINTVKRLQAEWKLIGQTPKKVNEVIYTKFRTTCDALFEKRRAIQAVKDEEFKGNLVTKIALCDKLDTIKAASSTSETVTNLMEEWATIGYIPQSEVEALSKRFNESLDKLINALTIDDTEKAKLKLFAQIGLIKDTPDARVIIAKKEQGIKRSIKELQDEADLLLNNLAFFAKSKNADALKKDIESKVDAMKLEIKILQDQLKIINESFK
jgi:hypothetical protein